MLQTEVTVGECSSPIHNGTPHPALAKRIRLRFRHAAQSLLGPAAHNQVLTRLARGASWSAVAALASRAMQLVATMISAHLLGKVGFGELAIIQTTVASFGAVAGFGLGTTETRYVSKYVASDPARAGRIMTLCSSVAWFTSLLTAAILFTAAPWIAATALNQGELTGTLRFAAILLLLTNVNAAQLGALAGLEAFQSIAAVNFWSGISSPLFMWVGINLGGVSGAVLGLSATVTIGYIFCKIKIRKASRAASIPDRSPGWFEERRILWGFSLPLFMASCSSGLANWLCTAFLARLPGGVAELGAFSAAYQLKRVPELLAGVILTPLLPIITERRHSGDPTGYRRALRLAHRFCFALIIPGAVVLTLWPRLCMSIFGVQFAGTEAVTRTFALQLFAMALFMPSATALASSGRMWLAAGINCAGGIIYLVLTLLLVPQFKGIGLALAFGSSVFVTYLVTWLFVRRREAASSEILAPERRSERAFKTPLFRAFERH